jgi:hypothetical protein
MKLTELSPKWIKQASGAIVGVEFACPVHAHLGLDANGWAPCILAQISVPFANPIGEAQPSDFRKGAVWNRSGDSFESLSLTPSIRCSQGDGKGEGGSLTHWHGFVGSNGAAPGDVLTLGDSMSATDGIDYPK